MQAVLHGNMGIWRLQDGQTTLGRSARCEVRLDDPRVSRRHVVLHIHNGHVRAQPCSSHNSVLINGDVLDGEQPLRDGDQLAFGPAVFRLKLMEDVQAEALGAARTPARVPSAAISKDDPRERHATEEMESVADRQHQPDDHAEPTPVPPTRDPSDSAALTARESHKPRLNSDIANALEASRQQPATNVYAPSASSMMQTESPLTGRDAYQDSGADSLESLPRIDQDEQRQAQPRKSTKPVASPATAAGAPAAPSTPSAAGFLVRRALAGTLDTGIIILTMLVAALPPVAAGYVMALQRAQAVILGDLPALSATGSEPATTSAILGSLMQAPGWARAWNLLEPLRAQDQQAFLYFFISLNIGLLFAFLGFLFAAVAGTTFKGGPWGHRRCGLQLSERRTGYFPTPMRACARWLCFLLLLPLAPFGLFLRRGLHDVIAGCQVDRK